MIKILFIGMTSNPGGLETYMINIFSKLEGHGFHFEFINMERNSLAYSKFIRDNGGIIRHVYIRGSRFEHLTRKHKADKFFCKHHDYDIVHLNTTYLNQLYWIKAANKYKIKHLIIQSHNCGMDYKSVLFRILNNILSNYNKMYLKCHHKIHKLAASKACGKWMFGKNSHFSVIRNGINVLSYVHNSKYRKILRNKLGINYSYKVIITTSRLEKQKNYPKIIRVFRIIHHYNNRTVLVIIGTGSQYRLIRCLIKEYNLTKYVYLLGQQSKDSVKHLLNIGDLMIMPSYYEAIPFSLTEAQASGIPAIVSREGIPKDANITNMIKYISLKSSDKLWAKEGLNILNKYPYNIMLKKKMNNSVRNSKYSMSYSIKQIKDYYLSLL